MTTVAKSDRRAVRTAAARLGDQLRAEADSGAALAEREALASPAPNDSVDSDRHAQD
jgi:hypothetical protein